MKQLFVIFGNQLFHPSFLKGYEDVPILMAETENLCTYFQFHKLKILFFLSAMRNYRDELRQRGLSVNYFQLDEHTGTHFDLLNTLHKKTSLSEIITFEVEDKAVEKQLLDWTKKNGVQWTQIRNPQFLVSREQFSKYLEGSKKPFMKTFYEQHRKKFQILMTSDGKPVGGQYSFDEDNRLKWPRGKSAPQMLSVPSSANIDAVKELILKKFANHPGAMDSLWVPTTRKAAQEWLQHFLNEKLLEFGPYEDAIHSVESVMNHSVLSPMMNVGLLLPADIIKETLKIAQAKNLPMNSVEGFIRQIMGWREFIRGIYQNYSEQQDQSNQWKHFKKLNKNWYEGTTGVPPLDDAIRRAWKTGYNHHIERLMILANTMNLAQIHPPEVHRWFMEMYMDSSEWVMGPNVYGMGLCSDGGIFATKPYICGSNYWLKMSDYKSGDWCDEVDGLYWQFIDRNRDFFMKNPRLSFTTKTLDRMSPDRKELLWKAAGQFMKRNTE